MQSISWKTMGDVGDIAFEISMRRANITVRPSRDAISESRANAARRVALVRGHSAQAARECFGRDRSSLRALLLRQVFQKIATRAP